jgi:hypothetical protein
MTAALLATKTVSERASGSSASPTGPCRTMTSARRASGHTTCAPAAGFRTAEGPGPHPEGGPDVYTTYEPDVHATIVNALMFASPGSPVLDTSPGSRRCPLPLSLLCSSCCFCSACFWQFSQCHDTVSIDSTVQHKPEASIEHP